MHLRAFSARSFFYFGNIPQASILTQRAQNDIILRNNSPRRFVLEKRFLSRGSAAYIIQAMLEYLVSLLVQTTFLARLAKEIGMSDGAVGIISAFVSLGCLFQLASLFLRKVKAKNFVVTMSVLNQLLFAFLYAVPLLPVSGKAKPFVFVVTILSAYVIYNIAHPKKVDWLMGLVDDKFRGSFTAVKEIVSLIAGIIFPVAMGNAVDRLYEAGNARGAFILCGTALTVLTVLHTCTLIISPASKTADKVPAKLNIAAVFKNKKVLLVSVLFVLWHIAAYSAMPFYAVFQVSKLGFSLTKATAIAAVGSGVRILVSPFLGKFADRKGFAPMLRLCFVLAFLAFTSVIFANKKTGTVCFILYYVFYCGAMGGINSSFTNLVFDVAPTDIRADALALTQAFSGAAGFIASVISGSLLNTLSVFGIYPEQILSVFASLFTLVCLVFLQVFFLRGKNES